MDISWAILKSHVLSKSLLIQYVDINNRYHVAALDGAFQLKCLIEQDGGADQVDFETNFKSTANKPLSQVAPPPFAAKKIGSKSLFKRVHGIQQAVTSGSNTIMFTVPYPACKITGVEFVNGENLDSASLEVLDTSSGTYSTVPNYSLNQFGFSVNISKDYYEHKSEFDADLYLNMQLKVTYQSASSKTVGVNFILNEVKS